MCVCVCSCVLVALFFTVCGFFCHRASNTSACPLLSPVSALASAPVSAPVAVTGHCCGAARVPCGHQRLRRHNTQQRLHHMGQRTVVCESMRAVVWSECMAGSMAGERGAYGVNRVVVLGRHTALLRATLLSPNALPPCSLSPPLIPSHPLSSLLNPPPNCLRCQPSFASDLTLQLLQDGVEIAAAQTRATVPVGQTQFVYRSKEALSVGGRVQCSFTVRHTHTQQQR